MNSYRDILPKKLLHFYETNKEISEWFDETKTLKSFRTAHHYLESLQLFLESTGKQPSDLLKIKSNAIYELMKKWCIQKLNEGIASSTLKRRWHGLNAFFKYHGKEVKQEVPFKANDKYLDKIPTKEELKRIIDSAPGLNTKVGIHLLAYSGLRPEDACDLTYGCIKQDYEKGVIPCAIYVPHQKTGNVYVTFMPQPTIDLMHQYLDQRRKVGEKITDSTPLLRDEHAAKSLVKGFRRKTLGMKIKAAMERSGIPLTSTFGNRVQRMRPYSLRKYFRSKLSGNVPSEFLEGWMGHTNGLSGIYGGQRDLDPDTIEKGRAYYRQAENSLICESVKSSRVNGLEKVLQESDNRIKELEAKLEEYRQTQMVREPADETMNRLLDDPEVQRVLIKKIRKLEKIERDESLDYK